MRVQITYQQIRETRDKINTRVLAASDEMMVLLHAGFIAIIIVVVVVVFQHVARHNNDAHATAYGGC